MRFKRLTAVVLCAVMLTGVFSVTASAAARTPAGMIDIYEDSTTFCEENQDAIEALYQGLMNFDSQINLRKYNISVNDALGLFDAAKHTHPELFFVDRQFGYGYNYSNILTSIAPQYIYTQTQVNGMLDEFYDKADYYLAMVNDGMDEFTKALVLHDALNINCTYLIEDSNGNQSNSYTFMVEGWGKCEDYSEVYAYLLAQEGIKSEIIKSSAMVHQWMKIKLDGSDYYYNVDITWDDPQMDGGSDVPGKVYHDYFLLSDEEFQQSLEHYDYSYVHQSDDTYDSYNNLHSLTNPLFYINGSLYTLYEGSDDKGYIATYNHSDDSLTNVLAVNDKWYVNGASGSYWIGNFSGIGEDSGLLYFNGDNCIYVYDPVTGEKTTYKDNVFSDGNKLYGMYVKDGKIYGLKATSPNEAATEEYICNCKKTYTVTYSYNAYDEATSSKVNKTYTKAVMNNGYTTEQLIENNKPAVMSAYYKYDSYSYTESGDTIAVTVNDTEKKYTVDFNGTETEHGFMELVTLNADEESSFVVDGRTVYVGTSYSFYVCADTTVTTEAPADSAEYTFINLNNVTVDDSRVSLDMLATANVGNNSYQRMGVAFALSEKTEAQIAAAVQNIETGNGTFDKIGVHNSSVDWYNQSGQYQFRYAPYFSRSQAKNRTLYFYTYVVTDSSVKVSSAAEYNMSNLLA